MDYTPEYTVLGIATAGVYATAYCGTSKISISIPDNRLDPYLGNLLDGGTVIDKRPCLNNDNFVSMIVTGPMLDDLLPDQHIRPFLEPVRPITKNDKLGPLDFVSLDIYIDIWKAVGARIGKRSNNSIIWDDGTTQEIPSPEERNNCNS